MKTSKTLVSLDRIGSHPAKFSVRITRITKYDDFDGELVIKCRSKRDAWCIVSALTLYGTDTKTVEGRVV